MSDVPIPLTGNVSAQWAAIFRVASRPDETVIPEQAAFAVVHTDSGINADDLFTFSATGQRLGLTLVIDSTPWIIPVVAVPDGATSKAWDGPWQSSAPPVILPPLPGKPPKAAPSSSDPTVPGRPLP